MNLKNALLLQRRVSFMTYRCPICGKNFKNDEPFDLHEVMITKGDVSKCSKDIREMINSPFNCVNVHSQNCHSYAQHSDFGKELCVQQILKFEGVTRVLMWLRQFGELLKTNTAENEIRLVNRILENQLEFNEEHLKCLQNYK